MLTSTLCCVVVNCPSSIARHAFRSTVHRTFRAGSRHAILACARIDCQNASRKYTLFLVLVNAMFEIDAHTNALGSGMIKCPSGVT